MATKKAKNSHRKATTKPVARKRSSVPFERIAALYTKGRTMEQIAKAVNRWNEKADDPSKSLRAIVSNMIVKGYRNSEGEVVKLAKRPRVKVEEPKASPKPKAKARAATA